MDIEKYGKRAKLLLDLVREDEEHIFENGPEYSNEFARMNVVHLRQDVILLVSHISSLNEQVQDLRHLIKRIFIAVVCVLVFICVLVFK